MIEYVLYTYVAGAAFATMRRLKQTLEYRACLTSLKKAVDERAGAPLPIPQISTSFAQTVTRQFGYIAYDVMPWLPNTPMRASLPKIPVWACALLCAHRSLLWPLDVFEIAWVNLVIVKNMQEFRMLCRTREWNEWISVSGQGVKKVRVELDVFKGTMRETESPAADG